MPKELYEIKAFNLGTMSSPAEEDIPEEAASHSLDLDPTAVQGKLVGRPINIDNFNSTGGDNLKANSMNYVTNKADDSKKDLIQYDYNSGSPKIKKFMDMQGAGTLSDVQSIAGSSKSSIQINNKEAHLGVGKLFSEKSKWIGYTNHTQFGYDEADIIVEDSNMVSTATFASMHKVVETATHLYGIKYQGTKIYKWDKTNNLMSYSSIGNRLVSTTAISLGGGTPMSQNADGTYLWIFDNTGPYGYIVKIDLGTLGVMSKHKLTSSLGGAPQMSIITDMVETSNKLWCAFWGGNGVAIDKSDYCLFAIPKTTFSTVGAAVDLGGNKDAWSAHPIYQSLSGRNISTMGTNPLDATNGARGLWATLGGHASTPPVEAASSVYIKYRKLSLVNCSSSNTEIAFITSELDGAAYPIFYNIDYTYNHWAAYKIGNMPVAFVMSESWPESFSALGTGEPNVTKCLPVVIGQIGASFNNFFACSESPITGQQWGLFTQNTNELLGICQNKDYLYMTTKGDWTGGATNGDAIKIQRLPAIKSIASYDDIWDYEWLTGAGTGNNAEASDWTHGGSGTPSFNGDKVKLCILGVYADREDVGGDCGNEDNFAWSPQVNTNLTTVFKKVDFNSTIDTPVISTKGDVDNLHGTVNVFESNGNGLWATYTQTSTALDTFTPITKSPIILSNSNDTSSTVHASWVASKNYRYTTSFVYDGYQESPIGEHETWAMGVTTYNQDVTIEIHNLDSNAQFIDNLKRVSHVNLYRAEDINGNYSLYRLVESIKLDDRWSHVIDATWGDYKTYSLVDSYTVGASYDANAGMSELITSKGMNYELSTSLNSHLFVAKAYNDDVGYEPTFIYKSLPYKYDSFDYSMDFLILPEIPTALTSFRGRIYVFTKNKTYKIDPNSMYIEDTYDGIGCSSQQSFVVTEFGFCFANHEHIFMHDGNRPKVISSVIDQSEFGTFGYQEIISSHTPFVTFDSKRMSFIIFIGASYAWCYNLPSNRWDMWTGLDCNSTVLGENGEMLISTVTALTHYAGHAATLSAWEWVSKSIVMGETNRSKRLDSLQLMYSGTVPTFYYALNNAAISGSTSFDTLSPAVGYLKRKRLKIKAHNIQVKLTGAADTIIDNLGILFRRLSGIK